MTNVLNRLTNQLIVDAHVPDYVPDVNNNNTPWIIDPDLVQVQYTDSKYWVVEANNSVRSMSPQEIDTNPIFVAEAQQVQIAEIEAICSAVHHWTANNIGRKS